MATTHAHDDAHAPTHVEHTGHGGHHVLSRQTLLRTIGALAFLTGVTVLLAYGERDGWLPLGRLSIPVALAIAAAKATLVAMYFMGLKYDKGSNPLIFVASILFLIIFFVFTYFDTGFRDTFDDFTAVPVDVLDAREAELGRRDSLIQAAISPSSLVNAPDTLLLPGATTDPAAAASQSAPAPGAASDGTGTPDARAAGADAPPENTGATAPATPATPTPTN